MSGVHHLTYTITENAQFHMNLMISHSSFLLLASKLHFFIYSNTIQRQTPSEYSIFTKQTMMSSLRTSANTQTSCVQFHLMLFIYVQTHNSLYSLTFNFIRLVLLWNCVKRHFAIKIRWEKKPFAFHVDNAYYYG